MGRINCGGGDGGDPVRSPQGRSRFRRPRWGADPVFDLGAPLERLKCSRRVPGSDAAFAPTVAWDRTNKLRIHAIINYIVL